MKKLVVGSTDPTKLEMVRTALRLEGLDGVSVHGTPTGSTVEKQPVSFDSVEAGARHRTQGPNMLPDTDIALGIQSGVGKRNDNWFSVVAVYVYVKNTGIGWSAMSSLFPLPLRAVEEAQAQGVVLTELTSYLTCKRETDPFKYFSGGTRSREEFILEAVRNVLAPLKNTERYLKIKPGR